MKWWLGRTVYNAWRTAYGEGEICGCTVEGRRDLRRDRKGGRQAEWRGEIKRGVHAKGWYVHDHMYVLFTFISFTIPSKVMLLYDQGIRSAPVSISQSSAANLNLFAEKLPLHSSSPSSILLRLQLLDGRLQAHRASSETDLQGLHIKSTIPYLLTVFDWRATIIFFACITIVTDGSWLLISCWIYQFFCLLRQNPQTDAFIDIGIP